MEALQRENIRLRSELDLQISKNGSLTMRLEAQRNLQSDKASSVRRVEDQLLEVQDQNIQA